MKNLLFYWFLLFVSVSPIFGQVPPELLGIWRGKVIEPGRSDWYPVVISIAEGEAGQTVATIFYHGYECGGALRVMRITTSPGFVMEEVLNEGLYRCINHGQVEIELAEGKRDQIHFTWSHADYKHRAIGYLMKQEL